MQRTGDADGRDWSLNLAVGRTPWINLMEGKSAQNELAARKLHKITN